MPPSASIIVPTRNRASYLDVALAGIRPQAEAHGAEVIVVDDGPDPATGAVAARHGAACLAHTASRGLNTARNTGAAHAASGLLVFVDDDVDVRPGWLAALLAADAAAPAHVGVFAGPIHVRIEDHRFPVCGREGPPVTALDLGDEDRDTDRNAWGANMTVRRTAFDAVGGFDEHLERFTYGAGAAGDEQEFQARVRAAGLTVRYVAGAALDHRRAGDDARLRGLMRAAYRRGGASRHFDDVRGEGPPLRNEVRTLLRCLLHGPRYRCANGPVMAAHSAGRLRAALGRDRPPVLAAAAPAPGPGVPSVPPSDDFTSGRSGTVGGRRGRALRLADRALDARLAGDPRMRHARAAAAALPPRRIHVIGVERAGMAMDAVRAELLRSHHHVTVDTTPVGGRGKFQNLNALLAERPADADWLLVVDDDIVLPPGFLDLFVGLAEETGLRLAQPAHRLHSHAAWPVTRRPSRPSRALVRETAFVEIGPVTLLHRDTFDALVPFPDLRMGWGLDAHWSAVARERHWPIGVVDATPILHLHPAAAGYDRDTALAEARAFLATRPYVRRDEAVTLRRLA